MRDAPPGEWQAIYINYLRSAIKVKSGSGRAAAAQTERDRRAQAQHISHAILLYKVACNLSNAPR